MTGNITLLIIVGVVMFAVLGGVTLIAHIYSLNGIKSRTVGDGQHGTARWANRSEIRKTYKHVPFTPEQWREQAKESKPPVTPDGQPLPQGIVVGCTGNTTAMVDTGDVHALMIGAAGVGKTAYWLYPCIEYACASGMSFLSTDTKGDIMRNYGQIAKDYGYHISVIDLRNPTRSNGNNLLHLVNKYMDLYQAHPDQLVYKARCEKYAKIISKTIILSGMDAASFGQNAYFYDAAEGLLTATILLVAEFCEPKKRHIVSVFKIIQELLAPSGKKGKNQFQQLMELLPNDHKAKWFAGAALNTAEQSMASVMSTALSRLNAFLDSELEQILCFDTEIDAEKFCKEKSALFIIMPEENPATFFMISLIIQQLYREILAVADENGGKLKNRCVFFCDEFGTLPKIESAEMMFSASRSRRLQIVPIIQSFSQLEKNYGKEGAEIIIDNTQLTIFGGFAPQSTSAETLSKALGTARNNGNLVGKALCALCAQAHLLAVAFHLPVDDKVNVFLLHGVWSAKSLGINSDFYAVQQQALRDVSFLHIFAAYKNAQFFNCYNFWCKSMLFHKRMIALLQQVQLFLHILLGFYKERICLAVYNVIRRKGLRQRRKRLFVIN